MEQRISAWDARMQRLLVRRPCTMSPIWRYGLAVLIVAVATALRWAALPWMGSNPLYVQALFAVVITILVAGIGPGLFSAVLGILAAEAFLRGPFGIQLDRAAAARMSVAILAAFFVGYLLHALRSALAQAQTHAQTTHAEIAVREGVEEELRQSREWLRVTLTSIGDAVMTCDTNGRVTFLNPVAAALTGWRPEEAQGQPIQNVFQIINEQTRVAAEDIVARVLNEGRVFELANHTALMTKDGREIPVEDSAAPILDSAGTVLGVVLVFHDVTEKRQKEEQLRRLSRTLKALNNSNQALLHATDEAALLKQVCRIITEDCDHAMVWIGFAEEDEQKTIRPVAHAGFEEGYIETLRLTWDDSERGRGPTGTTIRTGKPCSCQNMLTDPRFEPWRAEALKRGYASSLVLPLMEAGKAFGAITIYSTKPDAFSTDEIKLLAELAADVAYGITALRFRVAHAKATEELRRAKEQWERTFNSVPDLVAILDNQRRIVRVNQAMAQRLGTTPEACAGRSCFRSVHGASTPHEFCPHTLTLLDCKEHHYCPN